MPINLRSLPIPISIHFNISTNENFSRIKLYRLYSLQIVSYNLLKSLFCLFIKFASFVIWYMSIAKKTKYPWVLDGWFDGSPSFSRCYELYCSCRKSIMKEYNSVLQPLHKRTFATSSPKSYIWPSQKLVYFFFSLSQFAKVNNSL